MKVHVLLALVYSVSCAPQLPWANLINAVQKDDSQAAESYYDDELQAKWQAFKKKYGKVYEVNEEEMRRKIYETNLKKIELHNYLYDKGMKTYTLGENQYADMEAEEFIRRMTGYVMSDDSTSQRHDASIYMPPLVNITLPNTVDWRNKGYVTPVKNQGQCGSCWAFSATGSLEGQTYRKTGHLVSLSEQNLVDCSTKYGNRGCEGGIMAQAFQYIEDNDGIDTEECYPYTAQSNTCRFNNQCVGATVTGYTQIPRGNEAALTQATATVGPISVAINVMSSFQHYRSGVYNEPSCSQLTLNHAVLVVGYGTSDGIDYWLVKNSWGAKWGEAGYILMSRNRNNQCGIASMAVYPNV